MNETDIRNRDLIIQYLSHMGYTEECFLFAKNQLERPFIDPTYAELVGDDLRKRYEVSEKIVRSGGSSSGQENDPAWGLFEKYFHTMMCNTCMETYYKKKRDGLVSKEEFYANKKLVNKNELKIKKYMTDLYLLGDEGKQGFVRDCGNYYIDYNKNDPLTEEIVTTYIVRKFEEIGKYKATAKKEKKFELILSLNFADILLASTAQSNFSSCFDLDNGAYWYGVPGLIGDPNRAILYLTDGSTKDWMGITVPKAIWRTWVILSKKEDKAIVSFYGYNPFSVDTIRQVTGDEKYVMARDIRAGNGVEQKNPITPMFFSKGVASTVSNDASGISKFDKANKKIICQVGMGKGIEYISRDMEYASNSSISSSPRLPEVIKKKETFNKLCVTVRCCSVCGSARNLNIRDDKGEFICDTCFKEKKEICDICRTVFDKGTIELTLDGKKICKKCEERYVKTCECGNKVDIRRFDRKANGKHICRTCYEKDFAECRYCGEAIKKEGDNVKELNGNNYCKTCFVKITAVCSCCNKVVAKDKIKSLNNKAYCHECYETKIFTCRECKREHPIENKIIVHDHVTKRWKKRCKPCAAKVFPTYVPCAKCGELYEPTLLVAGICNKCTPKEEVKYAEAD